MRRRSPKCVSESWTFYSSLQVELLNSLIFPTPIWTHLQGAISDTEIFMIHDLPSWCLSQVEDVDESEKKDKKTKKIKEVRQVLWC